MAVMLGVFDSLAGFVLNIAEALVLNRERADEFPEVVDMRHEPGVDVHEQVQYEQEHYKRRKVELSSDLVTSQTQVENVDVVVGWLRDDSVSTVGICGMGGIGKTTLAQLVYVRLMGGGLVSSSDFRFVVVGWVSVGSEFDVYKVQGSIAEAFGFDIKHEKDLTRRAGIVSSRLSRPHGFVIILDDLWTGFCREEVGIPKDCKLVLVSRSRDVCRVLGCQKLIKVESLTEEESWLLFSHTLQAGKLDSGETQGIARHVCGECSGLPLAITVVAKSLRGVIDASVWNNVLDCLRRAPLKLAYLEDIFDTLRLSYDSLNDKLKKCLVYCALYPEGYAISEEELIHLWIGDMILSDAESLQAMHDMGHSIAKTLISSSLLEISEIKSRVKMHRLIRDLALSIAGDSFFVNSGTSLSEMSTELGWHENLRVVSLINSVSELRSDFSPKCPYLSTLLLQHSDLHVLPESFFLYMRGLRVLNLSYTGIERLPSSFSTLEELRVLDVSCCENLRQVPSMAKLQKLQFLDLSHTAISQIPGSFSMLKMLTELNLSSVPNLVKFPKGLPGFSILKKLSCEIGSTTTELLISLKCLETLDVRFSNIRDLSTYVRSHHWRTLESFHLHVGCNFQIMGTYCKFVSLIGCSLDAEGEDCIVLPDNLQKLYIENCRHVNSLTDIMKSNDVYYLRNSESCKRDGIRLEPEAFSSLETCTISRCQDLKVLFSLSSMQNFQHLELIQVEKCSNLKELIGGDRGNHPVTSLPQLRRIDLALLPQLNNIYKGRLICASLRTISVMDCPRLNRIPFFFDEYPSTLERIEGQEQWWDSLQWDRPELRTMLKPFLRWPSLTYLGESSKTIHGS